MCAMKLGVCSVLYTVLLLSIASFAQTVIPAGTVLPVQSNTGLNSRKSKAGQKITARIMQDVPLYDKGRIRAGSSVIGRVLRVSAGQNNEPAEITLAFDQVKYGDRLIPIRTSLRALASMMEIEYAQIPPSGPDRGTPWAWTTKNLIGGEVAYGEGGPVARGTQIVGKVVPDGALLPLRASRNSNCRDQVDTGDRLQALWVFSSDACGVYGIEGLEVAHAGNTEPLGEITLTSKKGDVKIRSGSGLLLRVIGTNSE
jgi:hypothetical protein